MSLLFQLFAPYLQENKSLLGWCRLRASRVLVIGLGGLGAEVVKNIVLSGVKSILLLDHIVVGNKDYSEISLSQSRQSAKLASRHAKGKQISCMRFNLKCLSRFALITKSTTMLLFNVVSVSRHCPEIYAFIMAFLTCTVDCTAIKLKIIYEIGFYNWWSSSLRKLIFLFILLIGEEQ